MKNLKKKLFEIIFEADTMHGKAFNITLLLIIVLSVFVVILESVPDIRLNYHDILFKLEWLFTSIFTIEYILRVWITPNRWKYIFSFYGIIDLIAILPAFLAIFIAGAHSLIIVRSFRLLRVFRILKISRYTNAGQSLLKALIASRAKIEVFLFAVITIVLLVGTLMYLIEGEINGFTSIPKSIYWAIVTLTTVGYGDLTPITTIGQFLSSILMILGYAIIAVPTGIISVEMSKISSSTQICPNCMKEGHDEEAVYCKFCGSEINP
jgi:voltage-gated potassium channel